MIFWVYIISDTRNSLKIGVFNGFMLEFDSIINNSNIVYLRWFKNSFDGLAHKSLLNKLSYQSIKQLILNNREFTKILVSKITNQYKRHQN